ncbi:MAG: hypothetical protein AAFZ91_16320 [Pseudomonadota bacterium]
MSVNTRGISTAPTAAHLCKLVGKTPEETAKLIIEFRSQTFTVQTWRAVDYLQRRLSGENAEFLISQANKDPRTAVGKAALETLPLINHYIEQHPYKKFYALSPSKLVLTPTLQVPLKPLGMVVNDEGAMILSGQVWKNISLNSHAFRLWATMLKFGVLDNDPDLDDFHWLEMSAPRKGGQRELNVRTLDAVGFYSEEEFSGYIRNIDAAMAIVDKAKKSKRQRKSDPKQGNFFGSDD